MCTPTCVFTHMHTQHVLVHGCPRGCPSCSPPGEAPGERTGQWIPGSMPLKSILPEGLTLLWHDKDRNWVSLTPKEEVSGQVRDAMPFNAVPSK